MQRFEQMMIEFFTVTIIGFFCFILMSGIFSHAVALWIFRIAITMGAITGAGYAGIRIFQTLTKHGLKIELFRAHIRKKSNEADFGIHALDHGLVLNYQTGAAQYFTKNRIEKQPDFPVIEQPVMPENVSAVRDLQPVIPEIIRAQRCRITAPQDGGKSTLIQWTVTERIRQGYDIICIDLHNFIAGPGNNWQGKYPEGCRVFGTGGNLREILNGFAFILSILNERYEEYSAGLVRERGHSPIMIVVDEMPELTEALPKEAVSFKFLMMTKARKAHIDYLETGQSKTAISSGTKGRHDLNRFDFSLDLCKDETGNRYGVGILNGKEERFYSLPGKFRIGYHGNTATHEGLKPDKRGGDSRVSGDSRVIGYDADMQEITDKPIRFYESKAEKQAVEMSDAGESLSKIATAVFGGKSGQRVKLIKEWIAKHLPLSD